MSKATEIEYGHHQKRFLEDRIRIYQETGFWDRNNEACWRLLKRDLKWALEHGYVSTSAAEPTERYANRCVENWRYWNIDKHVPKIAA